MGMFTKGQAAAANVIYDKAKQYLVEKDGFTHVLMINSFSKFANQSFECDNKYTTQINQILQCMQNDGYEVIDVKFNSLMGQGLTGNLEGFHTLITYK